MEVTIIRLSRKRMVIQVDSDLRVIVRVPQYASRKEIERIIEEKRAWIYNHIEKIEKKKAKYEELNAEKITEKEMISRNLHT